MNTLPKNGNGSPKRVGIWIRVSTEDQAQGESPKHHELRARAYAEAKGWQVVELYDLAGISGKSVLNHPEAKRMIEHVESGHIEGLVFSKLARLARNTRELLDICDKFKEFDADLVSLHEAIDTSTPAGRLFYTLNGAMAQWEREEISSRVAASVPIRAKLGKNTGGQASFGYQWKDNRLVIHPDEAPIRRKIYELFLEHRRKKRVANLLNEMGHRTRKGGKWTDTTIDRLLKDPTAKGLHVANYTKSRGQGLGWDMKSEDDWVTTEVEPCVSVELWEQCNAVLDESRLRARVKRKGRRPKHLFAGLAICHCGQKMYVPSDSPKYTCQKCRNKIPVKDLDTIFEEQIKGFFFSSDEVSQYISAADKHAEKQEDLLRVMDRDLAATSKAMDTLLDLYTQQRLSGDSFSERFSPLEDRKRELEKEKIRVQAEIDLLRIEKFSADHIAKEGHDLFGRWGSLSDDEKRPIVESFCDGIIIGKNEVEIKLVYFPSLKELSRSQRNLRGSSRR